MGLSYIVAAAVEILAISWFRPRPSEGLAVLTQEEQSSIFVSISIRIGRCVRETSNTP